MAENCTVDGGLICSLHAAAAGHTRTKVLRFKVLVLLQFNECALAQNVFLSTTSSTNEMATWMTWHTSFH